MKEKGYLNINAIINNMNYKDSKKELDRILLTDIGKIIFELTDRDLMDLASFFDDSLEYHNYSTNSDKNTGLIKVGLCTKEETNNILYGILCKYTYSLKNEVVDEIKSLIKKEYLTFKSKTF